MKTIYATLLLQCLAGFSPFCVLHAEQPRSTEQVSLRATLETLPNPLTKESLKKAAKEDESEKQRSTKCLSIALSAARTLTGKLTVTTTFYARDLAKRSVVVENTSKKEITLDAGHAAGFKTASVTFTYTPDHYKKSGGGRKAKAVKVEATGRRYHGWVIRVTQGETLLGEAASTAPLLRE